MSPSPGPDGRQVFEILVREHAPMLTSYLRSLMGNDSAVDDLFQSSMVVAWKRLADYDRSRPFGAWLRGIARNLVLEHTRKAAAARTESPEVLDELDRRYDSFSNGSKSFSERADEMLRCLASLPAAMREVVELAYARGLLLKEIALSMQISEETVKKRVQRARLALAQCVQDGNPQ